MKNRLEDLRHELDKLIMNNEPNNISMYSSHMYGVAKFCTLLAIKRNINIELATTCGMLHDIYYMTGGSSDNHATKGAQQAKTILEEMNTYSDDEIEIITTAISRHSDKRAIHSVYDELLKDADVMDHCLYNNDFPVAEWEVERYNHLLVEFGLTTTK
ncbi:MAG: HD domain-containing protein [Clostridiaceae bacterium]|nr:HD domain-containing protein [Clostridiaceae bacterium]